MRKIKILIKNLIKTYKLNIKLRHFSKDKAKILLLMTPIHGNIGDQCIALAEQQFFSKYFPKTTVDEISEEYLSVNNIKYIKKYISNYDAICIHGGGFLGTLWPEQQEILNQICKVLGNKKIVIFPQTVYYDDNQRLQQDKTIYDSCKDLYIFLRDESYIWAKKNLFTGKQNVFSVPDIVLSLSKWFEEDSIIRDKILLCFRQDLEKDFEDSKRNRVEEICKSILKNVQYTDTVVTHGIKPEFRKFECQNKLEEFLSAKIVITDRLHGMILSAITKTPCIAINNKSKKVSGVWNLWLKNNPTIRFLDDIDNLNEDCINEVINNNSLIPDYNIYWEKISLAIKGE